MSEKYKNRDERMKEIRRYLDGKMSDNERNSFEKRIQSDPFEEEALEGLSSLSPDDLDKDLNSLRAGLKRKVHKRTPLYYRIAAAVVVLLAISSLLLVRELNKPDILVSENLVEAEDTLYKVVNEPVEALDETKIIESEKTDQATVSSRTILDMEPAISEEQEVAEEELILDITDEETIPELDVSDKLQVSDTNNLELKRAIPERELVAEEAELVQAKAMVSEESNISATRAKKVKEAATPVMAKEQNIGEVAGVSVAETTKAEQEQVLRLLEEEVDPEIISDSGPWPLGGMKEFKDYLASDQIFPMGWQNSDKEVVKLKITIGISGDIEKIEIIKSPDKLFSDEAKRLIEEGPPWVPAVRDSNRAEESIKIRIVFQR